MKYIQFVQKIHQLYVVFVGRADTIRGHVQM